MKLVDGNLLSAGKNNFKYSLQDWNVAPSNSRFFVLDSLQEARSFAENKRLKNYKKYVIYECQIIGGVKGVGTKYIMDNKVFWDKFNADLLRKKKISQQEYGMRLLDIVSVLTRKVKLTKQVQ